MNYWFWLPYCIIYFVIAAAISKRLNDFPLNNKYFAWCLLLQVISIWPLIAKYSKSLLFDAMLYDFLCVLMYYGTLIVMGCGSGFTTLQWFGCVFVFIGLVLMKV